MAGKPHVAVIGAGIIGASIAWHLTRGGARVSVIEAEETAGGLASRASFCWINAAAGNPRPYVALRMASISGWRRLAAQVAGIDARFPGGIAWDLPRSELEAYCTEHSSWGYDIRLIERAEIARLEPRLIDPPEVAALAADEGMVEAAGAARVLIEASGAALLAGHGVKSLNVGNGRVTGVTAREEIAADAVVVAAGIATPGVLATAGIDFKLMTPPGILLYSAPHERLIEHLLVTPGMEVRQGSDGRLHAGLDFVGSFDELRPENTMMQVMATLRAMLKGAEHLRPDGFTVGEGPNPPDGFPAVGAVPGVAGLYVAVSHSGVTLAPAIGDMLAREILTGEVDALIEPYRFQRFI